MNNAEKQMEHALMRQTMRHEMCCEARSWTPVQAHSYAERDFSSLRDIPELLSRSDCLEKRGLLEEIALYGSCNSVYAQSMLSLWIDREMEPSRKS